MRWYLFPFALLYSLGVNIRNRLFDYNIYESKSFDFPVISIGNITVGGTGKTPHTEFLINWLKQKHKIATLSRGYKRKTKGFVEVETGSSVKQTGDEPLQMKRKFPDVKVAVDEKRVHGIETLMNKDDAPEIVLLDDAFQHRSVEPGINILLIDYNRPITKDYLMPVGNLREPAHNRKRANIIIVTKCPPEIQPIDFRIYYKELKVFPFQELFFTTFTYQKLKPVFNPNEKYDNIKSLKGVSVLVVTGIAHPKYLYKELDRAGAKVVKMPFKDHHQFNKADINKITNKYLSLKGNKRAILTTEKDAIRLRELPVDDGFRSLPLFYVPITIYFQNQGEKQFKEVISKYIARFYD